MSLILKQTKSGPNITPLEPGSYAAICIGLIDLGLQDNPKFSKQSNKIMILFELPDETLKFQDGSEVPRVLSKEFTMSMDEKSNLRKTLTTWRGRDFSEEEFKAFDLHKIVGAPAMVTTSLNAKQYAEIKGVSKAPKAFASMTSSTKPIVFDFDDFNDADSVDDYLENSNIPEWIQGKIKESLTYKDMLGKEDGSTEDDEDPTVEGYIEIANGKGGDLPF